MTVNEAEATPTTRTGLAFAALGVAVLLAVMDGTVVAVALEPLAGAFGTSMSTVVWLTVAYLVAAAAILPTLAWATARFGGRTVFLVGLTVFVLGSALCALAPSVGWLIGFRCLQGLGGGLLEPGAIALAASLANPASVGRVMGAMSAVINVAPVLGPLVGAFLATGLHWRWIFLVNIPLGVLVAAATRYLPSSPTHPLRAERSGGDGPKPSADIRGLSLLIAGYVAVLFALNRSGQGGAGWLIAATAVLGVAGLTAYARHALTATSTPALDLRLLRHKGFAASLGVMGFVGFIMYAQVAGLPVVGMQSYGLSGAAQGLLVCALGVGLLVSMSVGGRVSDRTGPRPLVRAGTAGIVVLFTLMALVHDALPLPAAVVVSVLIGLSFGLTASPTFASVYRVLPPAQQPTGTVALFMTVQLAASLGVTVLGLLQSSAGWITSLFVLLAAAAVGILVLSRSLPGPPTRASEP